MNCKYLLYFSFFTYCLCGKPWVAEPRDAEKWMSRHQKLLNLTAKYGSEAEIVFIGDSITAYWGSTGKKLWNRYYAPRHALNYGVSADRTDSLLYRIENGEFDGMTPKVVVLKIGTINIELNSVTETAIGIYEIIRQLKAKLPNTRVLLLGVDPRRGQIMYKIEELNDILSEFEDKENVFFMKMTDKFVTKKRKQMPDLYSDDWVHLSVKGYQTWYETMEPLLSKLLENRSMTTND